MSADRIGWTLALLAWAALAAGFAEGVRIELTTTAAALATALPGAR